MHGEFWEIHKMKGRGEDMKIRTQKKVLKKKGERRGLQI